MVRGVAWLILLLFAACGGGGGGGDPVVLVVEREPLGGDAGEAMPLFVVRVESGSVSRITIELESTGDLPEGRCVNPGHAIETAWFIMEEGKRRRDMDLVKRALPLIDWSLELGWDDTHGGILYFVDVEGRQPVQLEWDMKLWWPHNEAIYCTLLAYSLTGEQRYLDWFEKLHTWSHDHFPDTEHGEWIGYLHRDGSPALDLKGNYFKGPFHVPRQQLFCHLLLEEMLAR